MTFRSGAVRFGTGARAVVLVVGDRFGPGAISLMSLVTRSAAPYRFTIAGPDGKPVTAFAADQTKRLHFYAIRSDLNGFQHIHPVMAKEGVWAAHPAGLAPGSWRMFATFTPATGPGKGTAFVLSRTVTVTVPGSAATIPLPAASSATTVGGYTVTVKGA